MTISTYGVDVSGYQPDGRVDWQDPRVGFGIVKASESLGKSSAVGRHVKAIRAAQEVRIADPDSDVLQMGLYHFFHPDVDPVKQFKFFCSVAAQVDYGIGDIVPAVDMESYLKQNKTSVTVTPAWSEPLERLCELMSKKYGGCLPYCTWATWVQMGKPLWLLSYDLWVPCYAMNGHKPFPVCPHTPGNKAPRLWQNYVGPMFGSLTGQMQNTNSSVGVDQNIRYGDFQLILEVKD